MSSFTSHSQCKLPLILLLFILFLAAPVLKAQKTIDVAVSSNVFTPASLTIEVGDTVRWTNIGGNHNVNGDQGAFPDNPASFGNGPASPSAWVYTHVFQVPGVYNYQCDPHVSVNMFGSVTVEFTTDIYQNTNGKAHKSVQVYPSPASDLLNITLPEELFTQYQQLDLFVYDFNGKVIFEQRNLSESTINLAVSDWPSALYLYVLHGGDQVIENGHLLIQ